MRRGFESRQRTQHLGIHSKLTWAKIQVTDLDGRIRKTKMNE